MMSFMSCTAGFAALPFFKGFVYYPMSVCNEHVKQFLLGWGVEYLKIPLFNGSLREDHFGSDAAPSVWCL